MDKQIADQIITEFLPKIYGFAFKKSFSYEEAEELSAEIVHEVYLSLRHAAEVVNPEGYVWRISHHVYAKYVSAKKRMAGVSIDGLEIPYYDEIALGEEDEILHLRREIAFLTEKRRRAVYLYYYENRSIGEIAARLGIPAGTVKWHLNKARNDLKEVLSMEGKERKIGKLGLSPYIATDFSHSGSPGGKGPAAYLGDKLNLNVVYSVYHKPRTAEEIAQELGMTPVYLEDRIADLAANGFLVPTAGDRFTTYVEFAPETYDAEVWDRQMQKQLEVAAILAAEYAPLVREAVADVTDVYIPGGNRELFEAAAIFYGVSNRFRIRTGRDLDRYVIKTTDGGRYFVHVNTASRPSDPDYKRVIDPSLYWACGDMLRWSEKYPAVTAWSVDSRLTSRTGGWQNNLLSDYESLYEILSGTVTENAATAEKFDRLRRRGFLTAEGGVNIMVARGDFKEFTERIPPASEELMATFADFALEFAMIEAKNHPPQMQDRIVDRLAGSFINAHVAVMVMDALTESGALKPLTEREKITAQLIMFSDILP